MKVVILDLPKIQPSADGGECWVLVEDFHVLVDGMMFTVPAGFKTDGASIPRFLWRLCGHPMTTRRFPIAVFHDWLYDEGAALGLTRQQVDEIYRDGLLSLGYGKWTAATKYYALRLFGGSRWMTSTTPTTPTKEKT